jgi:hypothetical protein
VGQVTGIQEATLSQQRELLKCTRHRGQMAESIYYTAQVCENGHVINTEIENFPGVEQTFCTTCGKQTLTACPKCKNPIRGINRYTMTVDYHQAPAYCPDCGSAFPWTVSAIEAANELAVQTKMDEMDRTELPELIEDLVRQTPRTPVAAIRLNGLLQRAGPYAAEGFKQILMAVVTEGAKKLIWPS